LLYCQTVYMYPGLPLNPLQAKLGAGLGNEVIELLYSLMINLLNLIDQMQVESTT